MLRAALRDSGWDPVDLPEQNKSTIVSVPLGDRDAAPLLRALSDRGISCAARDGAPATRHPLLQPRRRHRAADDGTGVHERPARALTRISGRAVTLDRGQRPRSMIVRRIRLVAGRIHLTILTTRRAYGLRRLGLRCCI